MSFTHGRYQVSISPLESEFAFPHAKLPSHPSGLRPRPTLPARPIVRRRVIRKTSDPIHPNEAKLSLLDAVDQHRSKEVDLSLSQGNGHRSRQQLGIMLIIIITSIITFFFGIYAGQHGPCVPNPFLSLDPPESGLPAPDVPAPDLPASDSSPSHLLFDIHQPIVQLTTTIKTVPGFVNEIKQSLENFQRNLASAVYAPKRWAEACRGGKGPWRNWWDSPACDVGIAEYNKVYQESVDEFLSAMQGLETQLKVLHPYLATDWYTFQYLESILDSCISGIGRHIDRPPKDIASVYFGSLDMKTHTTSELHRVVRSLEMSLYRVHQSLDTVNDMALTVRAFLELQLGITSDRYTTADKELSWANQLLSHLEEQIRRRGDELEAWEIAVKVLEGSEEYGDLNLETVMSIAMGDRSVMSEGIYGGSGTEMLSYDIQLPSEKEQHIALSLARRGLRPLYLK